MISSNSGPIVLFLINFINFGVRFNICFVIYRFMNKQSQKRIIEINHAISGIHGDDIKTTASRINETRKQIMKKLERKKKLAPIIYDELYSYLEKFPEEKLGLNQQFVKKKKARLSELQEKYPYKCASFPQSESSQLTMGPKEELTALAHFFRYKLEDIDSDSQC